MSRHCFTYGSLMCADIMSRVCAVDLRSVPATLPGFSRHPVRDATYPGIQPAGNARVDGLLYLDLPESAWPRLDAFEGEMYARTLVQVELSGGHTAETWAYVFKPEHRHLLMTGDWDFKAFLRCGKSHFEVCYLGFDRLT
ncbi:MAG: gamma-glutamylcyclotransferase [Hydrogenophilales bacterium]|nr:gamma-glutamylcyclotransferase [Hydrogenophilales bacterium]